MTCDTQTPLSLSEHSSSESSDSSNNKPLVIGQHAKVSFEQVLRNGPPQDPPVETTTMPLIYNAIRRPKVRVLKGNTIREEFVYLSSSSSTSSDNEQQSHHHDYVYRRRNQKKTIRVKFGHVLFGTKLERVGTATSSQGKNKTSKKTLPLYQEAPDQQNMVAIKKLNKKQIQHYLAKGGKENPYVNIERMQTIGDNVHVLGCIEALQDDKYLYTVMPYCRGRSIMDSLLPSSSSSQEDDNNHYEHDDKEAAVSKIYAKLLQNIHYLQSHGICHHDLSPDNCLETMDGQLVVMDLAMSLQVPTNDSLAARCLIKPQGVHGKLPYLTPEVYMNQTPFDGFQLDVWAAGHVLYNLLTSHVLYHAPHPTDVLFKYWILAKGLSNEPLNERTVEVLIDVYTGAAPESNSGDPQDRQALMSRAMAHLCLSRQVMELLHCIFQVNPMDRYTLAQCMTDEWAMQQQ